MAAPIQAPFAVTHPGPFHADDVVAGAILRILHGPDLGFRRSAEEDDFNGAVAVFDVGRRWSPEDRRFDHHQGATLTHPEGIPCASAGLVWRTHGTEAVARILGIEASSRDATHIAEEVRRNLILPIDAWDNGHFPDDHGESTLFYSAAIHACAGVGNHDTGFEECVRMATRLVDGSIRAASQKLEQERAMEQALHHPDPSSLRIDRDHGGNFWLVSPSRRFSFALARDFFANRGISLEGLIQPNVPGRQGAGVVLRPEGVPPLPGEVFRHPGNGLVVVSSIEEVARHLLGANA